MQIKALEILFQQMHACAFDSTEVAREKQVILKEIVMRSTPPRSKVYQKTMSLSFQLQIENIRSLVIRNYIKLLPETSLQIIIIKDMYPTI